jgi:hypothetical protein
MALGEADEKLDSVSLRLSDLLSLGRPSPAVSLSAQFLGLGEPDGSHVRISAFTGKATPRALVRKASVFLSYNPTEAGIQTAEWNMLDEHGNEVAGMLIGRLVAPSAAEGAANGSLQAILIGVEGCGRFGGAGGMGQLRLQLPANVTDPFSGTLKFQQ